MRDRLKHTVMFFPEIINLSLADRNDAIIKSLKYLNEHPEDDWVLMSEDADKVLKSGLQKYEPTKNDIDILLKELGKTILLTSRPKATE